MSPLHFKVTFIYLLFYLGVEHTWRPEDKFQELVACIYHVGPKNSSGVLRLHLYLPPPLFLVSPLPHFFFLSQIERGNLG